MPPEIQQANVAPLGGNDSRSTSQAGLGRLLSLYRGPRTGAAATFILVCAACLSIVTPLAYGGWRTVYAYSEFGLAAGNLWGWPWFLLGLVAAVIVCLLAYLQIKRARRFVAIHAHGVRLRLGMFKNAVYHWSDIQGISNQAIQERFLHLPLKTTHEATLYLRNGQRIHLRGPFGRFPEMVQMIKTNLYPLVLPELRAQYQSGAWLTFGPLRIQQGGISLPAGRHPLIPWEQVQNLEVKSGELVIEIAGQRKERVAVVDIPNLELMLELIQQDKPL